MRRTCKRKPRQGGFFLLPNEIFTLGLSAGEIAVYAYLLFARTGKHTCATLLSENWRTHWHESQHGAEEHNAARGQAPYRNAADNGVDIGRRCEKRDAALYDPSIHEAVNYSLERQLAGCHRERLREKGGETKFGPVWPCVRFWRTDRGVTPAKLQTGPVGPLWPRL